MKKEIIILFSIILLVLFLGCTQDKNTYIISNTNLNKIFDANIVGSQGEIPFINADGNLLEVRKGFDFNKDTNTMFINNIDVNNIYTNTLVNDLNNNYGIKICSDGNIFLGKVAAKVC